MNFSGPGAFATSLILISLAGCSGGGGGGSGGASNAPMFIQTCSLGCSSGQAGAQVSCALVSTHVNQDIAIYFSEPVDPTTLNSSSINLVDVNTGSVPPGLRLIDPSNPKKVIFRPSITFDTAGNATFGFVDNHTYRIVVPGQAQGDSGPFIKSIGGKTNQSRMQCEIQTSLGIVDLVPGPPLVDVRVDQAIITTPNPNDTVPNIEAQGATDVWHNSTIRLTFNDIMNPATLAPNGISTFVSVAVDLDGDVTTDTDRQPLFGTYTVQQDTVLLTTTMIFAPTNGIPSSGNPLLNPTQRKIVVNIPDDLRDLAGTPLGNPELVAFTPEFIALQPVTLPDDDGENFVNTQLFDAARSSAEWGGGKLTRGFGGGSGRLGELVITSGQTVTLNTDSQEFPLPTQAGHDILDNLEPGVDYFPGHPELGATEPPPLTVTDGAFEFTVLTIQSGGRLVLTGAQPARVFSRGSINMGGILDVSGQTPAVHLSDDAAGGMGGAGGPNAGGGGNGASRDDVTNAALLNLPVFPAINIDETIITVDPNGMPGHGVGNVGTIAAGHGGLHNPDEFPFGVTQPEQGTMTYSDVVANCVAAQVASPGGGGAYATDGGVPSPNTATPNGLTFDFHPTAVNNSSNLPPVLASGGLASEVNIEPPGAPPVIRKLAFEQGNLRGGAGGGGGGSSMFGTNNGAPSFSCASGQLGEFWDHSACGGGGGGGAVQLVTGHTLTVSGVVDAGGGDGGSCPTLAGNQNSPAVERPAGGEPGGGGAGGAIRVQAQQIDLSGTTQIRLDVSGGNGGTNGHQSVGGLGGAGLVRLETSQEVLVAGDEAPHLGPQDQLVVGPDAQNILSVGNWVLPRRRPECFTGANSCWMQPTGNFFQIVFSADDPTNPDPNLKFGWNMDIIYDSGSGEHLIKFRGPDPGLPFTPTMATPDFEHFLGNTLNYGVPTGTGSYLAVRFQGAQAVGTLAQPCNLSLDPADHQILTGSLTPWVRRPADLNNFSPRPNIVRFTVVFDTSLALPVNSIPSFIKGVTNLKILAQPD